MALFDVFSALRSKPSKNGVAFDLLRASLTAPGTSSFGLFERSLGL
jgi:hypothetical protein